MQTVIEQLSKKEEEEELKRLFAEDLRLYLDDNPFLSVKAILRHMGNVVDESTLRRNLNQKHAPSAKTLRAFYAFKFKEERDEILLGLVPEAVSKVLERHYHVMQTPLSTGNQSRRIDIQISNDVHFAELYSFTAFEHGTALETIQDEFGRRSIQKINEMIASGILFYNPKTKKVYPGKHRSTYSRDAVQALAIASINNVSAKQGTNEGEEIGYIQFANLSTPALKELIEVEQEAHRRKLAIFNNPQNLGENKIFACSFVDSFTPDCEYTDNEVHHVH